MSPAALKVVIDGTDMPETEARAFWQRFSHHMDAKKGDLATFAAAEGLVSVHPEVRGGAAVLVGSRSAPQRPYGPASASRERGATTGASGGKTNGGHNPHSNGSARSPKRTSPGRGGRKG